MEFQKPKRFSRGGIRRGAPTYFSPRDILIMKYIWRWKIASTASIHEAVNRTGSPYSTYKVLERLEKNHVLEGRFNMADRFHVWQLTETGFHAIKRHLGELKENGFLSEFHYHDRLVQAFHLGEWATHQLPNVYFFTEQDMRRREASEYPEWVPQVTEHRPDGYTHIVGHVKPMTLAYEVELNAKSVQRYEAILRFYRTTRLVNRIFWLIDSPTIRDTILRAKACTKDDSSNYHLFVDLGDYEKNGWDAVATNERSETLFTLRENYQGICGEFYRDILGTFKGQSRVNVHLTNQKVIGKTRA